MEFYLQMLGVILIFALIVLAIAFFLRRQGK